MSSNRAPLWTLLVVLFVSGFSVTSKVFADEHIRGVITARAADGSVSVHDDTGSLVVVVFTDVTKVIRTDGIRVSKTDASTLIPGLRVRLAGDFDPAHHFVAETVSFSRSDLKTAQAIAGGTTITDQRSVNNQGRIDQHDQVLAQNKMTLDAHGQNLAANNQLIDKNARMTAAALENTNARIANLDNYNVLKTMTVYFANGKAAIPGKYQKELQQLVSEAKGVNTYMLQVEGFASAVGPEAMNQRLSSDRADAVVAVLNQNGIPPTSIVVPAAMGVSQQVSANNTSKGQAENRRAVITLLQNKGIVAGKE